MFRIRRLNARRDLRRFNLLHSFLDDADGCFADDGGNALFAGGNGSVSMQPLLPSSVRYGGSL
jgi:hypothetical protein